MNFSVLMSVYAKEKAEYLDRALQSIWDDQTLKPDEIVLVKDGPLTEPLEETIKRWEIKLSNYIKVICLPSNVGLGQALNEGLKHCSFDIIARMDSDDISLSERFEKQMDFMKRNPSIAASSTYIYEYDESLCTPLQVRSVPLTQDNIKHFAKKRSPLNHPSTIFRKDVILSLGGYPLDYVEDYALWSLLLAKGFILGNISEVMLHMRTGNSFFSRRGIDFLKKEITLLKYQREIKFISNFDYLLNFMIRCILRTSPNSIKSIFYKIARSNYH